MGLRFDAFPRNVVLGSASTDVLSNFWLFLLTSYNKMLFVLNKLITFAGTQALNESLFTQITPESRHN